MHKKFNGYPKPSNLFLLCASTYGKQRCKAVMKKVSHDPIATIEGIRRNFAEWSATHSILQDDFMRHREGVNWMPLPPGFVKVNFDDSWSATQSGCGLGLVIRDGNGACLAGASYVSSHNSVVEAKAMTALVGLQKAANMHQKKVVMEGDCLEVIDALKDDSCAHWRSFIILKKIVQLSLDFDEDLWNWIPRDTNR
ncbi:uncharacterized protein LOC126787517 [Argentina anserina]|uniref:uncharacterized protein LOC126787517 n=1 Tax=Argentina anserina TaxID=57926 RepID=UPI0021765BED|nr:uncharacterized protein LOC126787517 [Potentilla anserina]